MAKRQISEASLGRPSFTVDKEIHREFWKLANDNSLNKSDWLQKHMEDYIKKNKKQ